MWIVIADRNEENHYINTNYITSFKKDKEFENTIIEQVDGTIVAKGNITGKLAEMLRKSGEIIARIGE